MKREGRQHGMVRSCRILPSPLNPRPNTRYINRFESPPTAGLFTKVSPKPTNHSKFTGKCGTPRCSGCHLHPACKSKDKTKGTQKLKSADYRVATWRVVDERPGLCLSGLSATRIVDHLAGDAYTDYENEEIEADGVDESRYDSYCVTDDEIEVRTMRWNYAAVDEDEDDENGNWVRGDDLWIAEIGSQMDRVEEDEDWCLVESCS